jgi:hypothetical protein
MAIWYSLWPLGITIFPNFVGLDQEKSGNPGERDRDRERERERERERGEEEARS